MASMKRKMRSVVPAILALGISVATGLAADDWSDTVTRRGTGYAFSVPSSWRYIKPGGNGPEHYLEASGVALPAAANNAPVIATAFLITVPAASLDEARQITLRGYGENPDRVFPPDGKYQETDFKLTTGERAAFLSTHFFRKSKGLQQSRFDLVAYMPDHKRALVYTLAVQYSDETYTLERTLNLRNLAEKMFGSLALVK